ncbi:glyoxylase-like metal-dependent hydrolase (beta-lactamase superfamily II) [Symbiobacterium terraclitae]|uniref:Glyoxylase-like metal-dependent hydrolase (Beta-lactamase superfamily II) n=1 Tax=Symbiobacterium terraclitae TaxID=557451 RepID=A0ABS4JRV2_9FIRM|nr:MBL fold metallo-hydrolase [Symbiobacterium terraclitae]MBP2018267.1 glyoxylase-like metal-dependent hydrolase (beta-lactamase superfamily II) [Symbiobacterium terraclitae]
MRIWHRELGDFGANCYVVACEETGRALVIDPGYPDPWIRRCVEENGLTLEQIVLTHGHLDHIGGVEWVKGWSGAPVSIHQADADFLTDPARNGSLYFGRKVTAPPADRLLLDGDEVAAGNLRLEVIHTPGHSPGGICLYTPGHLFAGDTLFAGSIGRTDLYGGDYDTLIQAIRTRLLPLPAETAVYPGHGPATTIGDEKEYNPFLANR